MSELPVGSITWPDQRDKKRPAAPPAGSSATLRYEGAPRPAEQPPLTVADINEVVAKADAIDPRESLLAARLEIARYRERLGSFVDTYERGDQTGLAISALAAGAALDAPPPSLTALSELLAAAEAMAQHEDSGRLASRAAYEDARRLAAAAAAVRAAHPQLGEQ